MKELEPIKNVFKFTNGEHENEYEETEQSLISRIRFHFGFSGNKIVPLESESEFFEAFGFKYFYYSKVSFSVNGYGYTTNFKDIWRNEVYDDESVYEANHPKTDE